MRLIIKAIQPTLHSTERAGKFYEAMGIFDAGERERQADAEGELDLMMAIVDDSLANVLQAVGDEKLDKMAKLQRDIAAILMFRGQ